MPSGLSRVQLALATSNTVPEFPRSSLVPDQSLFGAPSKLERDPGSLNSSLSSSFTVISSAVMVTRLPSFGSGGSPFSAKSAGSLSRQASVANFSGIACSDDEDSEMDASFCGSDLSFKGLVSEEDSNNPNNDSNSLEFLTGEFRETLVPDTDSDDELPIMFNMPTTFQGRLYRPHNEKITVTFTKNNRKLTVVRSKPVSNDRAIVRPVIMARSIINHPSLTPLNKVLRPLADAENRNAEDRLREAATNCLLPIQIEVVKTKPS